MMEVYTKNSDFFNGLDSHYLAIYGFIMGGTSSNVVTFCLQNNADPFSYANKELKIGT